MGRKHREAMAAARASLNARYRGAGKAPDPVGVPCEAPSCRFARQRTTKTVIWPGAPRPMRACELSCAIELAGDENFDSARWG